MRSVLLMCAYIIAIMAADDSHHAFDVTYMAAMAFWAVYFMMDLGELFLKYSTPDKKNSSRNQKNEKWNYNG